MNDRSLPSEDVQTRISPFLMGLTGLTVDEIRKAKLLFIRNEITKLKGMIAGARSAWPIYILFGIVPVLWPIFWAQWNSYKVSIATHREQILNAIYTWTDELGEDAEQLHFELNRVTRSKRLLRRL